MKLYKRIRKYIRQWWACRTKQCDYYTHYLAYGPEELGHIGFHSAERLAKLHFDDCHRDTPCPTCARWERSLRA